GERTRRSRDGPAARTRLRLGRGRPARPTRSLGTRLVERLARRLHRDVRARRRRAARGPDPVDPGTAPARRRRAPGHCLCLAAVATELKPVYLIVGVDRPKIQRAIRRLRDRIGDESTELLSAVEAAGEDAVAACNSPGLFGSGGRLVVVSDVDRWKAADVKAIADYLAAPAPDTVLALAGEDTKKGSALAKACAKAGEILVYDVPKRRLAEWVAKQFADRGVESDAEACRLLIEIVGEDPEELATEVDKLATWADGERIGTHEVEQLASGCAEIPGYELTDAWGRRDI